MIRLMLRLTLGGMLVATMLSAASAQERLTTPLDYWNAVQSELEQGKNDIAARYLRGLISKKPSDKDLQAIQDKDGLPAILKLGNIRGWSDDRKDNDQALDDARTLIDLVTQANKKRVAAETRLKELIDQLQATPEERKYALGELVKAGAAAVPPLVDTYLRDDTAATRDSVVQALLRMGPATVAPLVAALDTGETMLKLDILDVLRKRHSERSAYIAPWLYFLTASKAEPASVRKRARDTLTELLKLPGDRLPSPKIALTREAERYFDHKVDLGDRKAVTVWRWDGRKLVDGWPDAKTVSADFAEHYYGQRFARQALTLDPDYRPAQLISLSLAADKSAPRSAEMLARARHDLVVEMLERALIEKRTNVALATVRALGDRAETRSKRPIRGNEPALARAMYSPDANIRLAAAIAWQNVPGVSPPKLTSRAVEVLAAGAASGEASGTAYRLLTEMAVKGTAPADQAAVSKALAAGVADPKLEAASQPAALNALARLDGEPAQAALVSVVLDAKRPVPPRAAAARALLLSIQRQGMRIPPTTLRALADLGAKTPADSELRQPLDSLRGALRLEQRESAELLRRYEFRPPRPKPAK